MTCNTYAKYAHIIHVCVIRIYLSCTVVQFLFEASDLTTEVTPKASSTCDEAEGAQGRPSTKRALFSDQYSELEDEITSLIASDIPSQQKPEEDVLSFDKQAFEANFCSLFLV